MLNHSVLQGRIGQELELKTTANGTEVISFSLAVPRNYNKEITDWITIVAWKGTATMIAKFFNKGDLICIEGSIQTQNYEDKNGNKVYKTEVVAERVHFVGDKSKDNATTSNEKTNATNQASDDVFKSDVFSNDGFVPLGNDDALPF